MSIRTKILAGTLVPLAVGMMVLLGVIVFSVRGQTDQRVASGRAQFEESVVATLRAQVEQARALVDAQLAEHGDLDRALDAVGSMAFGSSYVWAHSLDPREPARPKMVMHPIVPALEGEDVSDLRGLERVERVYYEGEIHDKGDPSVSHLENRAHLVDANLELVASKADHVVIEYYWPKAGVDASLADVGYRKVSYLAHLPEQGIVLGIGEYADFIDAEVAEIADEAWAQGRTVIVSVVLVALAIAGVLFGVTWFAVARVVGPIRDTTDMLRDISEGDGDLTVRLAEDGDGEVAEMARYFNRFVEKIRGIIEDVSGSTSQVSASATQMSQTSTQMTTAAQETSGKSQAVSAATEQISASIASVATAVEELDASVKEIASNSSSAATEASRAVERVEEANTTVLSLSDSSERIGNVISMIASIAEQTNLLALNATIEAARAGEAGRGFAVVANEVKDLAKGTADATEEITAQITSLQGEISTSSTAIGAITEIIRRISDTQSTIASAVEEQSVTIAEVASSVSDVSNGGNEIARNVATVAEVASESSRGAAELSAASDELSRMAEQLRALVVQFKV